MLPTQVARLGRFFQQSDQTALQRLGHLQQHQDGCVAHPGFQIRPMALGHPGPGGGGFAREATACPQAAHPLAQGHQIGVFLGVQILTHECTLMHLSARTMGLGVQVSLETLMLGNLDEKSLALAATFTASCRATAL